MDADNAPVRQIKPGNGGTVEPANRAPVAIERFQTPDDPPAERYELRDPFAEVTYRANALPDMVAKAEQLGSSRFVAVAEDGSRTPIQKVDGQWQRAPQRAAPERSADDTKPREDVPVPKTSNVVPMQDATKVPLPIAQVNAAEAKTLARLDAEAERAALVARLEATLMDRYIVKRAPVKLGDLSIGGTEYRFRGDTSRVAFIESTFKLATDTNSPSVARSMVDVAEARNWHALRVSGHEDFKRLVWLEASVRGVKTLGYEPNPADIEVLKREREARRVNRIEPARDAGATAATTTEPATGRGGARKTVLAAIEAVLVAKKVPEKQRLAVMAAATEKLAQRIREGREPKVKVYDKSAPSQRRAEVPTLERQRSRDRVAPTPTR